jgi:hypothetical protein
VYFLYVIQYPDLATEYEETYIIFFDTIITEKCFKIDTNKMSKEQLCKSEKPELQVVLRENKQEKGEKTVDYGGG